MSFVRVKWLVLVLVSLSPGVVTARSLTRSDSRGSTVFWPDYEHYGARQVTIPTGLLRPALSPPQESMLGYAWEIERVENPSQLQEASFAPTTFRISLRLVSEGQVRKKAFLGEWHHDSGYVVDLRRIPMQLVLDPDPTLALRDLAVKGSADSIRARVIQVLETPYVLNLLFPFSPSLHHLPDFFLDRPIDGTSLQGYEGTDEGKYALHLHQTIGDEAARAPWAAFLEGYISTHQERLEARGATLDQAAKDKREWELSKNSPAVPLSRAELEKVNLGSVDSREVVISDPDEEPIDIRPGLFRRACAALFRH